MIGTIAALDARHHGVRFDAAADAWIVTSYHDARTVLTGHNWTSDPLASRTNRASAASIGITESPFAQTMLLLDAPDHTRVRNSVRDVFTPGYIAQLSNGIEAIAADIVGAVPADTPFEFMSQVAQPFPIAVIAEWLGLDLSTATTLWREAATLVRALDAMVDPATLPAAAAAFTSLVAEFLPLAAARRADPCDDLLSLLATDPHLALDEVVVNAILLAIAGHETTANLLGASAVALFTPVGGCLPIDAVDPTDPRLIAELLRLHGPAHSVLRVATATHTIGGHHIATGDAVIVEIATANRDPDAFAAPDDLRFDRRGEPPHLAFGFGAHRCIGAALAQLETAVALELLVSRRAEVTGPPQLRDSTILHGLTSVPMIFREGMNR